MTLVKADNTQITKTAGNSLITAVPEKEPMVTVTIPVYELTTPSGTNYPPISRRLKWRTGQVIKRSEWDAAFPAATVASVSPPTGGIAGGTSVTIKGSGFTPGSTVTFAGGAATNISVINDGRITCKTPAHAAGAADVAVTSDAGTATKTGGFTYV
jgi:hypothetical protein